MKLAGQLPTRLRPQKPTEPKRTAYQAVHVVIMPHRQVLAGTAIEIEKETETETEIEIETHHLVHHLRGVTSSQCRLLHHQSQHTPTENAKQRKMQKHE